MRGIGRLQAAANKAKDARELRRKQQWQRKYNPARETVPVFLVGNGRSGTSMLVYHLTRSWHIDLYNEDNPAAFDKWFLRDLSVIKKIVADSCAPVTLFKPIKDTYRTHTLQARFPQAKVLFSFRHFDDVINSSRKRFYVDFGQKVGKTVEQITPPVDRWMADGFAEYADALPPEKTQQFIRSLWHESLSLESKIALHWLFVNSLFFDLDLDSDATVKAVRYESLVSNPQGEFEAICAFLTIPFEAKMVHDVFASSIKKKNAPDLDPAIRTACKAVYQRLCDAIGVQNEFAVAPQGIASQGG
ncbi:MAG: sulfotransferase [Chloroflexi bacterium]|nr:sulfotransferase [Chloroflexota bacterium]